MTCFWQGYGEGNQRRTMKTHQWRRTILTQPIQGRKSMEWNRQKKEKEVAVGIDGHMQLNNINHICLLLSSAARGLKTTWNVSNTIMKHGSCGAECWNSGTAESWFFFLFFISTVVKVLWGYEREEISLWLRPSYMDMANLFLLLDHYDEISRRCHKKSAICRQLSRFPSLLYIELKESSPDTNLFMEKVCLNEVLKSGRTKLLR